MKVLGLAIISLSMGMWGGLMVFYILSLKQERKYYEYMKKAYELMEAYSKRTQSNMDYLNHRILRVERLMSWTHNQAED